MINTNKQLKEIDVYIFGSCKSNTPDKEGYYVAEMKYKSVSKALCRKANNTTSNRMLLQAVIDVLTALKETCIINLYTPTHIGLGRIKNKQGEYRLTERTLNADLLNQVCMFILDGGFVINEFVTQEHKDRLKNMINKTNKKGSVN